MKRRYGNKQKQRAYMNAFNCIMHGYGKNFWDSCGLDEIEADYVWQAATEDWVRF